MTIKKIWTELINRVLQGEENIVSPFASDGIINSIFIIVQKDTGMGWGLIWCSKTHRGVHLSRMEVPGTVKSILSDDFDNYIESIPKIKFDSIN